MSNQVLKAQMELLKRNAWKDFYYFAKYVCKWSEMEEQPHREMCDFVMLGLDKWVDNKGNKVMKDWAPPRTVEECNELYGTDWEERAKKLIQVPRSTFKSTVISNALVLWLFWHNPNLRIMLGSETLGNAKLYLAAIKDQIKNNEILRAICVNEKGEYLLEGEEKLTGGWTDEQIQLKFRTDRGRKEPNMFLTSAENARTGLHPDVIIFDDLVSERNVSTKEQIEKTKNVYKYSLSLLDPTGIMFIVGTRYHMADLYNDLIEMPTYDKLVRPAVLENGDLYFPKRLTKAVLADKKTEQGTYIFNCQYMLTPIDDSNAVFKKAWINYYDEDVEKRIVQKFILSDWAISEAKNADYTVIMAVGITADKKVYVLEYVREHFNPHQAVNAYFEMYEKHIGVPNKIRKCQIESVAFQKAMLYLLKNEMKRRQVFLPLIETKPKKSKESRVRLLIPLFERGEVFIKPEMKTLETELLEFPYSKHDDIIDSLANLLEVMTPAASIGVGQHKYNYKPGCSITNY